VGDYCKFSVDFVLFFFFEVGYITFVELHGGIDLDFLFCRSSRGSRGGQSVR
jgi:hypothetical protein